MEIAEVIYLVVVALVLGGLIGYGVCYASHEYKCEHQFEEVLNIISSHDKSVVVHMCKNCGKRKITKV